MGRLAALLVALLAAALGVGLLAASTHAGDDTVGLYCPPDNDLGESYIDSYTIYAQTVPIGAGCYEAYLFTDYQETVSGTWDFTNVGWVYGTIRAYWGSGNGGPLNEEWDNISSDHNACLSDGTTCSGFTDTATGL